MYILWEMLNTITNLAISTWHDLIGLWVSGSLFDPIRLCYVKVAWFVVIFI